ncbi:MAG: protease inhibitor I42 family protein [Legionella sp.]|nr:protease inhibitor I42 family protein [Legionella sp.]
MKFISYIVLIFFSVMSFASDDMKVMLKGDDKNFTIMLPANPLTGNKWFIKQINNNLVTLVKTLYKKPETDVKIADGDMFFTFAVKNTATLPESTDILFEYAHTADSKASMHRKVIVYFKQKE